MAKATVYKYTDTSRLPAYLTTQELMAVMRISKPMALDIMQAHGCKIGRIWRLDKRELDKIFGQQA